MSELKGNIVGRKPKKNTSSSELDEYLSKKNKQLNSVLPRKWQKFGDLILFDCKTLDSEIWQDLEFLQLLCKHLKCERIGVKNAITNDKFRSPKVKILIGASSWVKFKDNGVVYTWDIEKCMFSSGNITERHRIATFDCTDQVVVDLFAGIGYFTIPYLKLAKCKYLYACEWNPDAVEALSRNLILNKVEDRCKILSGDNILTCPRGVADKVNLGLLPSCERVWETACLALKKEGGVLLVHGNVDVKNVLCECCTCARIKHFGHFLFTYNNQTQTLTLSDVKHNWRHDNWFNWSLHVVHTLCELMSDIHGGSWSSTCIHVHYVKSYAPKVDHLVLDVQLAPLVN